MQSIFILLPRMVYCLVLAEAAKDENCGRKFSSKGDKH